MAISLHNSVINAANTRTATPTVGTLTASIGEIVVVLVALEDTSGAVKTVSSISDGTANVYQKRFSASQVPEPLLGASERFEVWWAPVVNALVAATITVTLSAAPDDIVLIAAGYQGFTGVLYLTSPWDTNGSLPATAQNTSTQTRPQITGVSTTSTAGMVLFGGATTEFNNTPQVGPPTGFTTVQNQTNSGGSNAQQSALWNFAYSSAQSSATYQTVNAPPSTLGWTGWITWADALNSPSSGGGSVASSSGTGTASGVGSSSATSVASATGTGTATGIGKSTATSVGSASGVGVATGIGRALLTATATSTGSGTASGIGISTAASIATASGSSTASAIGQSTATSVASASGTSAVTGVAVSTAASVGSSSGSATVLGVGSSSGGGSAGTSVGSGTASGVGASTATATASATGTSSVSGIGTSLAVSVGTSSGSSTVTATGFGSGSATGTSSGTSTVSGVGASFATAIATASGTGVATGVGNSSSTQATATASGSSIVLGVSAVTISAVATSSGSSTVSGIPGATGGGGKTAWPKWGIERRSDVIYSDTIAKAAAHMSSLGGHARAKSLTGSERRNIAIIAAKARWQ